MKKRARSDFFVSVDDEPNHKKKLNQYEFFDGQLRRYIKTDQELLEEEQDQLRVILVSFPHASLSRDEGGWNNRFSSLEFSAFPQNLLYLAANAYDSYGNTMLGVACEFGYSVDAVQQLINIGADPNNPDDNMNKLPLHWAIANKVSYKNTDSDEAAAVVQCLLDNEARTDIICYDKMTPLEYARERKYSAACRMIEAHNARKFSPR